MDELIAAAVAVQGGDREAFKKVVKAIQSRQLNYIANLVKNRTEAEDLFQELCLKLFQHIHSFPTDCRSHANNWIYKISTNLCNDHFRKKKHQPGSETLKGNMEAPHAFDKQNTHFAWFERILEKIPLNKRLAFNLVVVNEVSIKDTAEILDVPEGTVKTWVHRAKKFLRDEWDKSFKR
jgi:RNA polymerase sigma-70 factor (ECF subfamily)